MFKVEQEIKEINIDIGQIFKKLLKYEQEIDTKKDIESEFHAVT